MASEPSYSVDNFEGMTLGDLGKVYLAVTMNFWEEAYDSFNTFVSEFRRGFGTRNDLEDAIESYNDMMEKSMESLGIQDENYEDSVPAIENAFIYGGNQHPDLEEFRSVVTAVLENEERWDDYAQNSHQL